MNGNELTEHFIRNLDIFSFWLAEVDTGSSNCVTRSGQSRHTDGCNSAPTACIQGPILVGGRGGVIHVGNFFWHTLDLLITMSSWAQSVWVHWSCSCASDQESPNLLMATFIPSFPFRKIYRNAGRNHINTDQNLKGMFHASCGIHTMNNWVCFKSNKKPYPNLF